MSNIYGYNRVSTKNQNLDRGRTSIETFCESRKYKLIKIFEDKATGKNFNRSRYIVMKEDVLRENDILVISEMDRLGRNKQEILNELRDLKNIGVRVMVIDVPTTLIDFVGMEDSVANLFLETINNVMIEMYAAWAEAEIERKKKRQTEGIEEMKRKGKWESYGRPRKMNLSEFEKEYKKVEEGLIRPFDLMKKLELKSQTYYRYRTELLKKRAETKSGHVCPL